MKIWFDVLTPKQLLFAEPFIARLSKNNQILCTTRDYRELNKLSSIRKIKTVSIGKHGGGKNTEKLMAGLQRMKLLTEIIRKFNPEVAITFHSPEASRVAFGLGIKHFSFSDSPHAIAVMKLTIPYIDKLLVPWMIPKKEFTKFGISSSNIIHYRAIDAAIIAKRDLKDNSIKFKKNRKKIIVLRMPDSQASYNTFIDKKIVPIINELIKKIPNSRILVSCRYTQQISFLRKKFKNKITFLRVIDSKNLFQFTDLFIGSGGTMSAEAAISGIPTISYSTRKDYWVDVFLVKKRLVIRRSQPKEIANLAKKLTEANSTAHKSRAKKFMNSMEDPFPILLKLIKSV